MAKILFFSPHAAIWVHSFPEALIAESLKQSGNQIIYITCGGLLKKYCISMSGLCVSRESDDLAKNAICKICERNKNLIRKSFQLPGYDLDTKIFDEDHKEINKVLSGITRDNFLNLMIDKVEVGRFATYQFLLEYKKSNLNFNAEEWNFYLDELRNSLYAFFAGRKILDSENPERIIVYNSLYSVNRMIGELAKHRKIPCYFLHAGGNLSNRLQTLIIGRDDTIQNINSTIKKWPTVKNQPCSRKEISLVTNHFLELFSGQSSFSYSAPKGKSLIDIRRCFGIESNQKLLVATMSSNDERFAAETVKGLPRVRPDIFPEQINWIQALIEYAKNREDLFLLIRVHPREFPNKRESIKSEQAKLLEKLLTDLPSNIKINWPKDNISLYDIAQETDVFLNAWSSVGKEMSLLGIPTVIYSQELIFYPAELNYLGTNRKEYFAQIEQALMDGWSFERIRQTYRWYALEFCKGVFDISESFYRSETKKNGLYKRVLNKIRRMHSPNFQEISDCKRRAKELVAKPLIAEIIQKGAYSVLDVSEEDNVTTTLEEETENILSELKRLMYSLYGKDLSRSRTTKLSRNFFNAVHQGNEWQNLNYL